MGFNIYLVLRYKQQYKASVLTNIQRTNYHHLQSRGEKRQKETERQQGSQRQLVNG